MANNPYGFTAADLAANGLRQERKTWETARAAQSRRAAHDARSRALAVRVPTRVWREGDDERADSRRAAGRKHRPQRANPHQRIAETAEAASRALSEQLAQASGGQVDPADLKRIRRSVNELRMALKMVLAAVEPALEKTA